MRRTRIRAKVAILLAVPLVALLVLSAFEVRQAANEAAQVRGETQLASAVAGPAGVIVGLQDERTWMSLELSALEASATGVAVVGYDETRAATDEAIEAFRADVESKGGTVEAIFREALDSLDQLGEIRRDIDDFAAPRSLDNMPFASQFYDRYTELAQGLIDANSRITGRVHDADLRRGTELVALTTQQFETQANMGRHTATAATLSPNGVDTNTEISTIASLLSDFDRTNEIITSTRGRYAPVVREHYPRELVEGMRSLTVDAIQTGSMGDMASFMEIVGVPPEEAFPGLREALADAVTDRADTLNDQATARQRLFIFLSLLALGLGAAMTLLVSLSITRPLRSLTHQARDMAQRQLPNAVRDILDTPPGQDVQVAPLKPVPVTSRDEVADVVAALNTVQESALDLATEQAVLRRNIADSFVNLGRRNQNLLSRQLDFITALESDETDPDTLASLFQLDHLATRMRRNAESLLVLAGIDPPRKWTAPVRVGDAIRAAVGEVEDYQRVRVDHVDPAMVQGSAAADLAHLLAELVENALTFSPPGEGVVVRGRWRDAETYRVTVIDQGLGMSPEAVALANSRLAGSESLTVAPSKFLGHHVAGNLAARHGIRIELEAGALRGIFATVDLPPSCLSDPADAVTGADSDPAAARPALPAAGASTPAFPPEWAYPATPPPGRMTQPVPGLETPMPPSTSPVPAYGGSMPSTGDPMPGLGSPTPSRGNPVPALGGAARLPTGPVPAVPSPALPPRDQLLAALETHAAAAQNRRPPSWQPAAATPTPAPPPVGAGPAFDGGTASGGVLPRRVPGAQNPATRTHPAHPAPLQNAYQEQGQQDVTQGQWAPRRDDGDEGGEGRADQVSAFLSGFSAGVKRGRDKVRRDGQDGDT